MFLIGMAMSRRLFNPSCGELAEDGAVVAGGGSGGWDFTAIDENDFAGLGSGVAVDGKAAMSDKVLDDRFGGGGVCFAIGQSVTQVGLPMPLEERPARIFRRPYAPFVPRSTRSPYLSFDVFNNFVMVDWHGCCLSLESQILNLRQPAVPGEFFDHLVIKCYATRSQRGGRVRVTPGSGGYLHTGEPIYHSSACEAADARH
jgi:hypothetical protein